MSDESNDLQPETPEDLSAEGTPETTEISGEPPPLLEEAEEIQEPVEPLAEQEVPPQAPEPEPVEKPPRTFLQRALRWVLGLLVIFGLGIVLAVFTLYLPATRGLSQAQRELQQAESQITELNAEVERVKADLQQQETRLRAELAAIEAENEDLSAGVEEANLHVHILSALADVRSAQLALAQEDTVQAQAHLTSTPRILENLESLVGSSQAELVAGMQERLSLAQQEIEGDVFAAQSDLEVLANNLVQLENIYFATP